MNLALVSLVLFCTAAIIVTALFILAVHDAKPSIIVKALSVFLALTFLGAVIIVLHVLKAEHQTYLKAGECIKEKVSLGVPRKNIVVVNSECFIKAN